MNPFIAVSEGAVDAAVTGVSDKIFGGADNFLGLVTKVGNTCVNNEICVMFLTCTFVGLGVRLLRRVIGAFGRGR